MAALKQITLAVKVLHRWKT